MIRTVVITGAAQGIGKGIAQLFAQNGFTCILLDKNKDTLAASAVELSTPETKHYEYVIDLGKPQAVEDFIGWLNERSLVVDILVNNVGYESEAALANLTSEEVQHSNDINLTGPFLLTSLLAKHMKEHQTKGNIVFISSTHSQVTRMHPLYSASKAAIEMFVKEAALELAPADIRVNAIAPGPTMDTSSPADNKYVPLGKSLQPRDVAEAVTFMVSEQARFITGQTLVVDGGFSIVHTHYWKNLDKL